MSQYGFPEGFDQQIRSAAGEAFFGRDVLSGLVQGLRRAAEPSRTERSPGSGVLGCALWIDDPELLDVLTLMGNVCVVVTKQHPKWLSRPDARPVRELAEAHGIDQSAFHELSEFAPSVGSEPLLVGPHTLDWTRQTRLGAVREVGFRKVSDRPVPLVHAKMALLGQMHWTDEHPSGALDDHTWFQPESLWIGSANFTRASRSSLEVGLWTHDPLLLAAARKFLLTLVAMSEPLGSGPDGMDPELSPVKFDDAEFIDYLRELGSAEGGEH